MQTIIYRMGKQQGLTVYHKEPCSVSYDKHNGKEYEKECINIKLNHLVV